VHNSTYKPIAQVGEDSTIMTKRSAQGRLKIEHWSLPLRAIRDTADHHVSLQEYLALVIGPLCHSPDNEPLTLPHRPQMPSDLAQSHPKGDLSLLLQFPKSPPEDQESQG
jgi:hypothetical protein